MSDQSTQARFTNKEVADLLALVADILQILDANRFRIIAFQNAAEAVKNFPQDLKAIHDQGKLQSIPGIGKGIAGALTELF
jgi:DNA polymerase (family 10)